MRGLFRELQSKKPPTTCAIPVRTHVLRAVYKAVPRQYVRRLFGSILERGEELGSGELDTARTNPRRLRVGRRGAATRDGESREVEEAQRRSA